MIFTPPLSALSSVRDQGMSETHMASEKEEWRKIRVQKKVWVYETEKNRQLENRLAIRQSLLSHENSPSLASKPCHPSPQCEGRPDRQPRKPGLQTVTTLISPDKSLICLIHRSLLLPLQNVKHAGIKDLPQGAAWRSSSCSKTKKMEHLWSLTAKATLKERAHANCVPQCKCISFSRLCWKKNWN